VLAHLGCAVRFRLQAKRSENEAKNFSLRSEKTGNHKRNENERSEISKAKRKRSESGRF
jgi:hypothetical protein